MLIALTIDPFELAKKTLIRIQINATLSKIYERMSTGNLYATGNFCGCVGATGDAGSGGLPAPDDDFLVPLPETDRVTGTGDGGATGLTS
ncbi:MAG TPA: hypothetical protein VGN34_12580, partial [Ktedonobacteraceae bacterium]